MLHGALGAPRSAAAQTASACRLPACSRACCSTSSRCSRQALAALHSAIQVDNPWRQAPSSRRRLATVTAAGRLPNQAGSVFNPNDRSDDGFLTGLTVAERPTKSVADLDYLSELLAIQQNDGPKSLGFFGTRNMGMTHQKLVEILSYALVSTGNHIFTSGATGTNAAVIKGALRADAPELLTVILPQSLSKQPTESQELLVQVEKVIEMPQNDKMSLMEASRICNREIIAKVQQVICFAFHDSRLLLETCAESKESKKIVTLFYLD